MYWCNGKFDRGNETVHSRGGVCATKGLLIEVFTVYVHFRQESK